MLAAVLGNQPVRCVTGETTIFNPPPNLSCGAYANPLLTQGYITNPNAVANCEYCQYSSGAEYLSTINVSPSDKWRNFGIFLVFVCTNYLLVYFFIYFVRVKGFTFGMGPLFGTLGKGVDKVKSAISKPFQKKQKGDVEEGNEKE